jgi:hypothetical protein
MIPANTSYESGKHELSRKVRAGSRFPDITTSVISRRIVVVVVVVVLFKI